MGNNPVNYVDPTGEIAFLAPAIPLIVEGIASAAVTYGVFSMASNGVENVQQAIERKAYKKRCSEPPPCNLKGIDLERWKLKQKEDCLRMREEFGHKYFNDKGPGHEIINENLIKGIQNSMEKIVEMMR